MGWVEVRGVGREVEVGEARAGWVGHQPAQGEVRHME
jgi:hypothetical protein